MYYEVYLDIYFLENLFMDYALLFVTGMVIKCSVQKKRIFFAAFAGSVFSCLLVVLPSWIRGIAPWSGLFLPVWLVRCGYGRLHRKMWIKGAAVFFLLSFLCAGLLQMAAEICRLPVIMLEMPVIILLGILPGWYGSISRDTEALRSVRLTLHGEYRELYALRDTGNRLREPYQKRPVSIVEYEAVRELMQGEESVFLIPCRTVHSKSQLLSAMVFDEMEVTVGTKSEKIRYPVIAFAREKLSSDSSYQMILHPDHSIDL